MNVKLFYGVLIALITLSSCSKDDSSKESTDIIIGKWRAIKMYEADTEVDLPTCLPFIYEEYRSNKTMDSGRVNSNEFPEECRSIAFVLGWKWDNLGNNRYQIYRYQGQELMFTIYKDGGKLVKEDAYGTTKTIYEPYL